MGERAPDPGVRAARPMLPEEWVAVGCMSLLACITMGNVLVRYFTDRSFAWTEEISVFLLVLLTLSGAAAVALRDRHIRVEYFYDNGSAARRRGLRIFAGVATVLFFIALTVLFARITYDDIRYAETTMGLNVPRWWYTIWVPAGSLLVTIRALAFTLAQWRAGSAALDEE